MTDSPTVAAFISAARAAVPTLRGVSFRVRTFGNSAAMADVIVPLILRGEKTGTFALEAEIAAGGGDPPQVGDHYVVTRFDGEPVLIYRLTAVERVPYQEIAERHTAVEGPGARSVDVWRKIHWDYWGSWLRSLGREPTLDMPVLFQRFTVVFPDSR